MKVLVVKMSSMGDIIGAFPAMYDLLRKVPGVEIDWVVEESFSDLFDLLSIKPNFVIPVAMRRWKKNLFSNFGEIRKFICLLRKKNYDYIIDAQGLIKSAVILCFAKGIIKAGFGFRSSREFAAPIFYNLKSDVDMKNKHALKLRELFSNIFKYSIFDLSFDYNLKNSFDLSNVKCSKADDKKNGHIFFFHGTTWKSKHLKDCYWIDIAKFINQTYPNLKIYVTWGNEKEREFAYFLRSKSENIFIVARCSFVELSELISTSRFVIGIDTGLSHLAAAVRVPVFVLYGPTNSELYGVVGENVKLLQSKFICSACQKRSCKHLANKNENYSLCMSNYCLSELFGLIEHNFR